MENLDKLKLHFALILVLAIPLWENCSKRRLE